MLPVSFYRPLSNASFSIGVRKQSTDFQLYLFWWFPKINFASTHYIMGGTSKTLHFSLRGNSVVMDVQFGHLFLVCIKYVALQEVTCVLFRKISHCSLYMYIE